MSTIRIESILGGEAPMTHFAAKDQFRSSIGIDPAYPYDTTTKATASRVLKASGLLRPVGSSKFTGTTLTAAPMWQVSNPKNALVYVYDINGSTYSIDPSGPTITALSDAGTMSAGGGYGCEYYDNYIYFSILNDLVRYGPLNGSPGFVASYWQGVLSLASLSTPSTPPIAYNNNLKYPSQVLHRHSDGKMYILHASGGQGAVSFVCTTKTTVEGDTNNGSTYAKLLFGYGLVPIAVASYGSGLVFGLMETAGTAAHNKNKAKLAFWDTTSSSWNSMLWDEFPDEIITAIKNINGVLYIASGNYGQYGCRISQYVGGYTIKQIAYYESATPPFQGGIDGEADNIIFGSTQDVPDQCGSVYSIGLHKAGLSKGLFNTMRATGTGSSVMVTSLGINHYAAMSMQDAWVGWSDATINNGTKNGIDQVAEDWTNAQSVWQSQVYRIGAPFTIDRVRVPLAQSIVAGMTIVPKIIFDNGRSSLTLPNIDSTTFPNGEYVARIPVDGTGTNVNRGDTNFLLELRWTGTVLVTAELPIEIDFTVVPDM